MKLNCFQVLVSASLLLDLASCAIITRRNAVLSPVSIEIAATGLTSPYNEAESRSLELADLNRAQPTIEIHLENKPNARKAIVRDVTDPFKRMMRWAKRAAQQPVIGGALSSFALRNGLIPDIVSSLSPNTVPIGKSVRKRHRRQQTYVKRTSAVMRKSAPAVANSIGLDSGLSAFDSNALTVSGNSPNDRVPEHVYDNLIKQAFEIPLSASETPLVGPVAQLDHPLAVGVIRIDNAPGSENGDDLQNQLGPFATIIREMLKDSQPLVDKHYNEGNDLEEEEYHQKVVSPTEVVIHTPQGYQVRRRPNPLALVLRKFVPIVRPFAPQTPQRLPRPIIGPLPQPVDRLFRAFWNKQHHLASLNHVLEHINSHPDKPKLIEVLQSEPRQPGEPTKESNETTEEQPDLSKEILGPMKQLMDRMKELEKLKDLLNGLKESLSAAPKPPQEEQPKLDQSTALLQNVVSNIDGMKNLHQLINKKPSADGPSKSPLIIRFVDEQDAPSPIGKEVPPLDTRPQVDEPVKSSSLDNLIAPAKPVVDSIAVQTPPTKNSPSKEPRAAELVDTMQKMIGTLKDLKPKGDKPEEPKPQTLPTLDPQSLTRINQMAEVLPLALVLSRQKQDKENFFNRLKQNNNTNNLSNFQNINVTNNFEEPQTVEPPVQPAPPAEDPPRKHHIKVNVHTEPPANVVHVKAEEPEPQEDPCEAQKCDEKIKEAILNIEVEQPAKALKHTN